MVSVNVEVVNTQRFMDVFNSFCPQFNGDKRKCCVVVSSNELSYIYILWLIYFLIAQTTEDVHKYIMALRECQLNELQPGQEDTSVTALS